MSYIIDKFNNGEVHTRGNVLGWYFTETDEFRPLMADAMFELYAADLVTDTQVAATAEAHEAYTADFLAGYIQAQRNRTAEQIREERYEARAAMGPGVEMINVFTGERYRT